MSVRQEVRPVARFEEADRGLRPAMSLQQILFMCMGSIIGSGWLFASLGAMNDAGPAAIISWVVAGVFFIVIGLAFGEVGGMLPRSGALVRYPELTHGSYAGWILGWTYWVSVVATPAIEAEAVVTYVGGRFPQANLLYVAQGIEVLTPTGIAFAVGLMLVFFVLNVLGIRLLAEWNRWFTWWKIIIPVATFCFLFLVFKSQNFNAYGGFFPTGSDAAFQTLSISGIAFAYLGFRQAVEFGGESRNPSRDIPLATVLSVVLAMVIYVALQVGMIGALDWDDAGVNPGNWGALLGSDWAATPLFSALVAAGIPSMLIFSNFLLIDAGVSPAGTGWIFLGGAVRGSYGMSVHGYGPRVLQAHNRFGIPWVSAITAFVVGCVFFIPAPSWYALVGFITSTLVLTMIVGGVAVPVFRRHAPQLHRPYRLQAASVMAPAAFCAAVVIFYWSGFEVLASVYAAIFVGLPLFTWTYTQRRGWVQPAYGWIVGLVFLGAWIYIHRMGGWVFVPVPPAPGGWPFGVYDLAMSAAVIFFSVALWAGAADDECRLHVRRCAWLIFLLLALFPLSHYGQFGPLDNPQLPFPWDTLVAVGVGLIAYYWGMRSGFQTKEMREIVEAQSASAPAPQR